ncbi:hypothetical protein K6Y74_36035, partial [Burkholderia cenocepacia]|uniref:hypothetical protein n=1 Tax=Burkholderia cenocepacia TaxID=95486 RepID=UPI00222F1BB3
MARVDATTMATALRVILARQPGNSASRQRERLLQAFSAFGRVCSGQLIPDTALSFSSATAGASPSLN